MSPASTVRTHQEVFRRAAARTGAVGGVLVALGLLAGLLAGGRAWNGAAWGAGAGALLTAITVAALAVPWDRPLLASSGVMVSFAGKIVVMVGVVVLAGPHRSAMSPAWFLVTLAAVLLGVTAVEIASLANGRALTVESEAKGE